MPDSKSVLIVEDEKPLTLALTAKLKKENFTVTSASNGAEALAALDTGGFDAIIMDLVMPEMDGFALLTAMQDRNIQEPIIVLSNLSQESDIKRAKELGADAFLVKSDTPLVDIVKKVNELMK